jgi:hypothetical protein
LLLASRYPRSSKGALREQRNGIRKEISKDSPTNERVQAKFKLPGSKGNLVHILFCEEFTSIQKLALRQQRLGLLLMHSGLSSHNVHGKYVWPLDRRLITKINESTTKCQSISITHIDWALQLSSRIVIGDRQIKGR